MFCPQTCGSLATVLASLPPSGWQQLLVQQLLGHETRTAELEAPPAAMPAVTLAGDMPKKQQARVQSLGEDCETQQLSLNCRPHLLGTQ